jgi:hypothetical protein
VFVCCFPCVSPLLRLSSLVCMLYTLPAYGVIFPCVCGLTLTSSILNHEIMHLHGMWISEHSIQWNNSGITETPDDGLRLKHVMKGRSDGNCCIADGIILLETYWCNEMLNYNIVITKKDLTVWHKYLTSCCQCIKKLPGTDITPFPCNRLTNAHNTKAQGEKMK